MIRTTKVAAVVGATFALAMFSTLTLAKVSASEAAELGKSLTPVGAEKAGNTAGTIPAWDGQEVITEDSNGFMTNPYADEKPLFVITASNMGQYKDKLTPGIQRMLTLYPDTYKLPVYKTHRPVTSEQWVYEKAKANATTAVLAEGGNGVQNYDQTLPFPIPANGLEAVWNHTTRNKGGAYESYTTQAVVQANGSFSPVRLYDNWVSPYGLAEGFDAKKDDNILFYFMRKAVAPARLTGNVLLVHETMDQVKEARRAWSYNAGQRRVRRAPTVAYDGPGFAAEGTRATDNVDLFNGAPDRYNWKLVGKKEMYVPYNSYALTSKDLAYKDILTKGHINQDYTRYELHRVWVVEATLKDTSRHVYGKRVLYIDEDSWQAVLADHFDGRGELWRVAEGHLTYQSAKKVTNIAVETLYDVLSGRYIAMNMTNEEKKSINYAFSPTRRTFKPSALRRAGK